jgi:hypothetical protein
VKDQRGPVLPEIDTSPVVLDPIVRSDHAGGVMPPPHGTGH